MSRGSVWWAELGVVITSNLGLAAAPGNVRLPKGVAGLPKASVVNVSQLVTLDRSRLAELCGAVTSAQVTEVDAGLRLVLNVRR